MKLVTNSEIQTFKDCRRKWWFSHWRQLRRKRQTARVPREVGDVVHKRIDRYYQGGMVDDVMAELEKDQARMLEQFPDQEKDVKEIIEFARIMLTGYFEWLEETGADAHLTILESESVVRTEILEGVELGGKLDARVFNSETNARQFLETKTTGSFDELLKLAHLNEQFYEYHLLERLTQEDDDPRTDGTLLNMLRRVKRTSRAKPPFYAREPVWHNETELRSFYHRVIGTISDILRVEYQLANGENPLRVVYPRPSRDCSWKCDFADVCPMVDDDNVDHEGYLEAHFERHDPNQRYSGTESEEDA